MAQSTMNVEDELRKGLKSTPKYIPFWFLYDKQGSVLFERCWRDNHDHYMSTTEKSLIQQHIQEILNEVPTPIILIDIGSGNCEKSRMFIDGILNRQPQLQFIPVDMSQEFLLETSESLAKEYGKRIDVQPIAAEYVEGIEKLRNVRGNKLILWFGGLQNLPYHVQVDNIRKLAQAMSVTDRLVLSLDITQNAQEIKLAYLDPNGIMADFYRNAFARLNRDYGSDIDTGLLVIEVEYTQRKECNTCSYLTMRARAKEQLAYTIPGLGISIHLEKGEVINISDSGAESTCKYSVEQIQDLTQSGKQELQKTWVDPKQHIALCCLAEKI